MGYSFLGQAVEHNSAQTVEFENYSKTLTTFLQPEAAMPFPLPWSLGPGNETTEVHVYASSAHCFQRIAFQTIQGTRYKVVSSCCCRNNKVGRISLSLATKVTRLLCYSCSCTCVGTSQLITRCSPLILADSLT